MLRTPPRHLAPPVRVRPPTRNHLPVESVLALAAIVLTAAIVAGSMLDRQQSSAARLPNLSPPAPTTTRAAAVATSPATAVASPAARGNPIANPGFEAGLTGWRPLGGTGVERVDGAREGDWAAQLTRGSAKLPGLLLADILRVRTHQVYHATIWVRAARPGATVRVNLFEVLGGRRSSVDTAAAVAGGRWRRLEVRHEGRRGGAALAVEVLAPGLAAGSRLLVDDLAVGARAGGSDAGR